MSPRIYMDLVEALMFKGYSYDDAGPLAYELMSDPESIVDIPDFVGPPRSDDLSMQAEGGRVGLQNGGEPGFLEKILGENIADLNVLLWFPGVVQAYL